MEVLAAKVASATADSLAIREAGTGVGAVIVAVAFAILAEEVRTLLAAHLRLYYTLIFEL